MKCLIRLTSGGALSMDYHRGGGGWGWGAEGGGGSGEEVPSVKWIII